MKVVARLVLIAVTVMLIMTGCGGGSGTAVNSASSGKGTIALSINLNDLVAKTSAKSLALTAPAPVVITSATVEISRSGYEPISTIMTISGNVASCRIDDLDQGYWHVTVHIFSDAGEIYTGSSDGNVLPGTTAQVTILFDPVDPPTMTTGSISISAGINPMPGYKVINQQVTKALLDAAGNKLYIYDATTKLIGVYDAGTMDRTRDFNLPSSPNTVALTTGADAILLGYSSGQIYKLDVSTGAVTLLGDSLMNVSKIVALNANRALLCSDQNYESVFKTMDLATGQILYSKSNWYNFGDLVLNEFNGTVYAQDVSVSPTDIFRIRVDFSTGEITEISDSSYHGDFSLGQPLRVIRNGSRVVTASGAVFTSSTVNSQDLIYSGSLGYPYTDLAVDFGKNKLYSLYNGSPGKLLILDQDSFFLQSSVELKGTPKNVYVTPSKIIVLTALDSATSYAKVFDKAALGL